MKILCFIDSLGFGGAQRQLVELAKGFKENDHSVTFLTYHPINYLKFELDIAGIDVRTISESNYLLRLIKIRRFIRSHNPHAILSFLTASNLMAIVSGFPVKRWILIVGERSSNPSLRSNFKLRAYRYLYFFADYIVANSHKNIDIVKSILPFVKGEKFKVIYNSVNVSSGVQRSDFDSGKTSIVVTASYRGVKNLDGLIDAVKGLSAHYRDQLSICWYGDISIDEEYYMSCKNMINENSLEHIFELNDKIDDVAKVIRISDFVGLFSHYEGFPNSICEGMAMGKPIIVTSVSDVPFFIKESVNGFLCDSHSPESIRNAIQRAIESSDLARQEMGILNSKIAAVEFDRRMIVEKYMNLFKNGIS